MQKGEVVTLFLVCEECAAQRQARIPKEKGLMTGIYRWLCPECQARRPLALVPYRSSEPSEGEER